MAAANTHLPFQIKTQQGILKKINKYDLKIDFLMPLFLNFQVLLTDI